MYEKMELMRNKYQKEAIIELELEDAMNKHQLEITKENGKTIGKINMGYGAIKIITRGEISLIQKEDVKDIEKNKKMVK